MKMKKGYKNFFISLHFIPGKRGLPASAAPEVHSGRQQQQQPQQHHQQQQPPPPQPASRNSSVARPFSRGSRPPSAVENHLDYFKEPVVKSPPEPTRVRSPEGAVRSPDPINWTVPLDTGKTFSVTQSVKDGGKHICL